MLTNPRTFKAMLLAVLFTALSACTAPNGSPTSATDSNAASADGNPMTPERIEAIVARIAEDYQADGNAIVFAFNELGVTIVTDAQADRMRVVIPIMPAAQLDEALLYRLMQANFDSALDARYAIAQGMLWSTFIHPLSSLNDEDLLSGIGQAINTAESFGTSFSSGALVFGGGDTTEMQRRELIESLKKKGQSI